MIRRFFTLIIFVGTVNLAVFGQHIFGRDDVAHWGQRLRTEAPVQTAIAWKKTDKILANLVPEAGTDPLAACSFDDYQWAIRFHS